MHGATIRTLARTSENSLMAKFAEIQFSDIG
jgi:hypothetical protein